MINKSLLPPLMALQFLTRVPVPWLTDISAEDAKAALDKSMLYFPLIGGMIGLADAFVFTVSLGVWPKIVAVLVTLAFEALLTGAFHEDALADFCDGFGGGMTAERIHEIMKDSRIGTYGTVGLLLGIAIKVACFSFIPNNHLFYVLPAMGAISRFFGVIMMAKIPRANVKVGIAKDIANNASMSDVIKAFGFTFLFSVSYLIVNPIQLLYIAFAYVFLFIWLNKLLIKRLGGATGDCYGFGIYSAQILFLLLNLVR